MKIVCNFLDFLNDDEHLYGKAVARDDDPPICILAENFVLDRKYEANLENCDDDDIVNLIMMTRDFDDDGMQFHQVKLSRRR